MIFAADRKPRTLLGVSKSTLLIPHWAGIAASLPLMILAGCSTTPRQADLDARQVFEQLQPGVSVGISGSDYSKVEAIGLTDTNRAQFVAGMATGCVEAEGELRPMTRSEGWVCYLPSQDREAFAVLYRAESIQLLRGVGTSEGLERELRGYGYARSAR